MKYLDVESGCPDDGWLKEGPTGQGPGRVPHVLSN